MTPLANGNLTAAELDRLIVAEKAYNEAKARGESDEVALDAARAAVRERFRVQVLRSVGVEC